MTGHGNDSQAASDTVAALVGRDCQTCRFDRVEVNGRVLPCANPKQDELGVWTAPLGPCPGWEAK
jgi:hypothetical protein